MSDSLFENILDKVQNFLASKGIKIVSEKTLMSALPLVIECVETIKTKGVSGEEKKSLVLRVILFIVRESELDDEKKETLRRLIESEALETTIDIIIATSKGEFKLNRKNKRKLFICMSQCFEICAESISKIHLPSGLTSLHGAKATVEEVVEAAEDAAETVKEVVEAAEEAAEDAAETVKEVVEAAEEAVEDASETVKEVVEAAEEAVVAVVEDAPEEALPELPVVINVENADEESSVRNVKVSRSSMV